MTDWRDLAACQVADPRWFDYVVDDGRQESTQARLRRFANARAVCTGCPVAAQCVEGRTLQDDGIRGGVLYRQGSKLPQPWPLLPGQTGGVEPGPPQATPRRPLRNRSTGRTPIRLAPCGTYAAARRHERNNQHIDPACRSALNAKEAARVHRRRGAA